MTDPAPFAPDPGTLRPPLLGRVEELTEIRRVIRNRGRLLLIGPRRSGKTRLLSEAGREAADAGAVVLRVDAERFESPEVLASVLLSAAARALRTPAERLVGLVVRGGVRPVIELDEATGAAEVRFGPDGGEGLAVVLAALDAVEALATGTSREVVVMLEEVQVLLEEGGAEAAVGLRESMAGHGRVAYVLSSSAVARMTAVAADPAGALHGLASIRFLGALPYAELLSHLTGGFRSAGMEPVDGACERLVAEADGVPGDVQRLAHEVWVLVRGEGGERVTPALVERALERLVSREDASYLRQWLSLTRNQKKALKAVFETGGEALQSAEVSRRHGVSPASVQVAVGALESRGLIRREERAGRTRFRPVDPYMGAWIRWSQRA